MIEQLLTNFVFDKLNKQIVKKIPYCLLFALVITFFIGFVPLMTYVSVIFFTFFVISSGYFNYKASKVSEDIWTDMDFQGVVGKLSSIFEGGSSWLKDIRIRKSSFVISGLLSGIAFTVTLTSVFLVLLSVIHLDETLIVVVSIFAALYIFQDAAKGELIEEPEKGNKSTLLYDMMNAYLVENSVRTFSLGTTVSKVALALFAPIVGPLIYFRFPKTAFRELIVQSNNDLKELFMKYQQGHDEIHFEHEGGKVLNDVFAIENDTENITIFSEKSQKEVLPYLLDPDYKPPSEDKKKWVAFSIEKKPKIGTKKRAGKKIIGHIFIHGFKGRIMTTVNENNDYVKKAKRRDILLIMIVGERGIVQHLETRIGAITPKAPLDKMV